MILSNVLLVELLPWTFKVGLHASCMWWMVTHFFESVKTIMEWVINTTRWSVKNFFFSFFFCFFGPITKIDCSYICNNIAWYISKLNCLNQFSVSFRINWPILLKSRNTKKICHGNIFLLLEGSQFLILWYISRYQGSKQEHDLKELFSFWNIS